MKLYTERSNTIEDTISPVYMLGIRDYKEYHDKFKTSLNNDIIEHQQSWKKHEKLLAPLAFPTLTQEHQKRDSLHYS